MKLKQLVYFAAVAENGSFNGASKALFIAQSSLSTVVAELEKELGFELLIRSRRGVRLTGMGEVVYANIKEVLKTIDAYENEWQQLYAQNAAVNIPVVAAVVPSLYTVFCKRVVEELKVDYPNLNIAVFEARGEQLKEYMISGKVDMIFSDCMESAYQDEKKLLMDKGFQVEEIGNDNYKLALKESKKNSVSGNLTALQAADISLACYTGGDAPADEFMKRGFDAEKRVEFNSIQRIYQAVLAGGCAGCLPERATLLTQEMDPKMSEISFYTLEGFCVPFVHFGCCKKDAQIEQVYRIVADKFIQVIK